MKQPAYIGEFTIISGTVVIADPGYDLYDAARPGLGAICENCANGEWRVHTTMKSLQDSSFEIPDVLIASHESTTSGFDDPTENWEAFPEPVGGDYAMIGIYDRAHFHDDGVIPKDHAWNFCDTSAPPIPTTSGIPTTARSSTANMRPLCFLMAACWTGMEAYGSQSLGTIPAGSL